MPSNLPKNQWNFCKDFWPSSPGRIKKVRFFWNKLTFSMWSFWRSYLDFFPVCQIVHNNCLAYEDSKFLQIYQMTMIHTLLFWNDYIWVKIFSKEVFSENSTYVVIGPFYYTMCPKIIPDQLLFFTKGDLWTLKELNNSRLIRSESRHRGLD